MADVVQWMERYEALLWSLAAASLALFLVTLIVVPMVIVRLPEDYFAVERRPLRPVVNRHPVLRVMILIVRNVLGLVLVSAGLLMLVLPGQGVVAILVGLTLLEFPGKYRLERWIVSWRPVCLVFNWLRRRAGKRPLLIDTHP